MGIVDVIMDSIGNGTAEIINAIVTNLTTVILGVLTGVLVSIGKLLKNVYNSFKYEWYIKELNEVLGDAVNYAQANFGKSIYGGYTKRDIAIEYIQKFKPSILETEGADKLAMKLDAKVEEITKKYTTRQLEVKKDI